MEDCGVLRPPWGEEGKGQDLVHKRQCQLTQEKVRDLQHEGQRGLCHHVNPQTATSNCQHFKFKIHHHNKKFSSFVSIQVSTDINKSVPSTSYWRQNQVLTVMPKLFIFYRQRQTLLVCLFLTRETQYYFPSSFHSQFQVSNLMMKAKLR